MNYRFEIRNDGKTLREVRCDNTFTLLRAKRYALKQMRQVAQLHKINIKELELHPKHTTEHEN